MTEFEDRIVSAIYGNTECVYLDGFPQVTKAKELLLEVGDPGNDPIRYFAGSMYEAFGPDGLLGGVGTRLAGGYEVQVMIWDNLSNDPPRPEVFDLLRRYSDRFHLTASGTRTGEEDLAHGLLIGDAIVLEDGHASFDEYPDGLEMRAVAKRNPESAAEFKRLFLKLYNGMLAAQR